jgi:hypothetical protein
MIYYFDSETEVNMCNLPQIKEVRPLRQMLDRLVTKDVEVRYTNNYTDLGVYIVEVSKHTHQWTGHHSSYHSFNLLEHVPVYVLDAVRQKKIRLVIIATVEGGNFKQDFWDGFRSMTEVIKKFDLPAFGVVIVSANLKADSEYNAWCVKHNEEVKIEFLGGVENPLTGFYFDTPPCAVLAAENKSPKDFSSLNRSPSLHRIDHLYTLASNNLLDNALVSGGHYHDEVTLAPTFITCDTPQYKSILKKFYPRSIDVADLTTNNPANVINLEIYLKSMLAVVTETWYEKPGLTFSEKAFRPIVTGNPQMILGQPEITKYLSKFGYNLEFKGLDTSFDEEFNHVKRFKKFHKTLSYWCALPLERKRHLVLNEWRDQLEENKKIHRQNNYGKFISNDIVSSSIEYFKK